MLHVDMLNAPKRVAERAFYFRLAHSEDTWRRLEPVRLTRPEDAPMVPEFTWPTGAQVEVRVSVFEAGGRLFAGAVEVRTAPEPVDVPALGLTIPALPVEVRPVDTDLWRMVPLGALCREAVQGLFTEEAAFEAAAELAEDPEAYERLAAATPVRRGSRSPGRPSTLTPALLAFVAEAVSHAGPRGAQAAAQRALQYAAGRTEDGSAIPGMEFRGSAPNGAVTADQAKKAIAKARSAGLIPRAGMTDQDDM